MSSAPSSNASAIKIRLRRKEAGIADVTEQENIIRRWARLKQASKAERAADTTSDGAVAATTPTQAAAAVDAPFDLASLPSIESIVADTDIIAFLRAGVPAELTRAALRRAWASDPAIRDFIGIAENQWDFNEPDAIPGFGPLTPMEDAADAIAQISSRFGGVIAEVTSPGDAASASAAGEEPPTVDTQRAGLIDRDLPRETLETNPEQGENRLPDGPGKPRRHGGALPR
jgi:Protein of unknown function (DUF3306)